MEFQILGPLEVRADGRALPLGAGQQRRLLALLLLRVNETVSRDRLIHELWGERPPRTAAKALQGHVSTLRKLLEPDRGPSVDGRVILTRGSGYELRLESDQLDLGRFERLREEGRRAQAQGDPERAAVRLREALSLWHGPPLADFAYEPFAQAEITRLEDLRVATLEDRVEADLAVGRHAELVGELEALVKEHPLRERLRAQLMLALYRAGRQAEALDAYQAARQALVEELGIEPGRELRELHQAILRQDARLDGASAAESGVEPAWDELRGVFVGREGELAQLRAGLSDALAGHGGLFLLGGEPGIGKSRLADELIRDARGRGARVLAGRCWEAGGAPAYWPWVQALRGYIRELEPETLRDRLGSGAVEVAQILPELRELLPGLPEPASFDSEGARFRLFDAAAEFLQSASRSRPILLVLDDLHAADAPSLLLLQFLARELHSMRMLTLATYRDVDPTPVQPLTEMLGAVVRERSTRRLSLGGLAEREVADYVEQTASELASPELIAALHEETEGNPLFLSEMVRLLSVEGVRSKSPAELRLVIPQNVHDVIARRLSHLSEGCNRILVLASVLGREFALDALARLADVSEDELLETLDEAMAGRLVSDVPGGPGRLRFAHVLIRDTLYEGLTTARRIRLHRHAVQALAGLHGETPGQYLAELAYHAMRGRDFAKGLAYARRAGDHALALLAYEEAARLYETSLEALELGGVHDEEARCELLLARGEAEARAGNAERAKEAFLAAADIARHRGLSRQFARAAGGYAREDMYLRAGGDEQLVSLLEEALAALGEGDIELRARLLGRLAGALRDEPAPDRRDRLSADAVDLARSTGNLVALAYALDGRVAAIVAPDTLDESLALAAELREVSERIGDRVRAFHGHLHRLVALVMVGDVGELEASVDAMSRIAAELRQPSELWDVYAGRAALALAAGRLAEAERLTARAFAVGESAKPEVAIPTHVLQRLALGDFRRQFEIEPALRELVAVYPARVAFRCALAHLHARMGRVREAQQELDALAVDRFTAVPFDHEWLFAMSLLAETTAHLGDGDSATVLYELLLPYAAFNAADWPEGFRGSMSRDLGLLAMTTKRWEKAERHFEAALAVNEERGARAWLAWTQHDYGRMLLERAEPGDAERGGELMALSKALSQELGMTALAEMSG
jgi:eukaryotic-like serine/threonine-protein kinase